MVTFVLSIVCGLKEKVTNTLETKSENFKVAIFLPKPWSVWKLSVKSYLRIWFHSKFWGLKNEAHCPDLVNDLEPKHNNHLRCRKIGTTRAELSATNDTQFALKEVEKRGVITRRFRKHGLISVGSISLCPQDSATSDDKLVRTHLIHFELTLARNAPGLSHDII